MDAETRRRIESTVSEILKRADIDSMTELSVRAMAAEQLRLDLSDLTSKKLISTLIDSFLLELQLTEDEDNTPAVNAVEADGDAVLRTCSIPPMRQESERVKEEEAEQRKDDVVPVAGGGGCGFSRVICDLSKRRHVTVSGSKGSTVVSITEFYEKDGNRVPTQKGAIMTSEQWSIFKNSIPAIEETLSKAMSKARLKLEQRQARDARFESSAGKAQLVNSNSRNELDQQKQMHNSPVSTGQMLDQATHINSTLSGLVPVDVIRFNGTNYNQWLASIQPRLNQLKVAHVLFDPCPSSRGVNREEVGQFLAAVQKWMGDDYICRLNILNSLSDPLFDQYAKKSGTAKELWEELELIYLHEEHGSRVSLVKKYLEFQMVEGKSVLHQVQEFHEIANSIIAAGMFVEEKFHVNVILFKLPPSWKGFSVKLMKEEHLPVWHLMDHIKHEESSRGRGSPNEVALKRVNTPEHQHMKKLGPPVTVMKKPGNSHAYHEPEKDRRILKFCHFCKKKGHVTDQCWLRKFRSHDHSGVATPHADADVNTDKLVQ